MLAKFLKNKRLVEYKDIDDFGKVIMNKSSVVILQYSISRKVQRKTP